MVQNEGEKAERLAPSPTAAIGRGVGTWPGGSHLPHTVPASLILVTLSPL